VWVATHRFLKFEEATVADQPSISIQQESLDEPSIRDFKGRKWSEFPWWFVGLILILISAFIFIFVSPDYREALNFIKAGLGVTIKISLTSYGIALIFGLLAGLGRISKNMFFNNLARLYVEFIRGIPMLVLIFFIAFVMVPTAVEVVGLENAAISMEMRAISALAITYGAFLAEIFRAGIQSITKGQMEAARSLGMSYGQAMRYVILPQAIRNVLPALGNDFVAMVKDSSLVSVLAVRDITQLSRLYAGSTFRFREAYFTVAMLYLSLTLVLSLLVQWMERRLRRDER
jgi:polar amino acid transport system permease protein